MKDTNELDDNLLNGIELNEKYEQKENGKESKKNKRKHKDDGDDDDEDKKKKSAKYDEFLAKDNEEDVKSKGIFILDFILSFLCMDNFISLLI